MDPQNQQTEAYMGQLMAVQPRLRAYLRMLIYKPSDANDQMQRYKAGISITQQAYFKAPPSRRQ